MAIREVFFEVERPHLIGLRDLSADFVDRPQQAASENRIPRQLLVGVGCVPYSPELGGLVEDGVRREAHVWWVAASSMFE